MSNRMPCRITDDPYYDYSDYIEGEGVYEHYRDDDAEQDDAPEYMDFLDDDPYNHCSPNLVVKELPACEEDSLT